jgi:hypothetical protein
MLKVMDEMEGMRREEARKKIAAECRRIGRELNGAMQNPRAP